MPAVSDPAPEKAGAGRFFGLYTSLSKVTVKKFVCAYDKMGLRYVNFLSNLSETF
jgi:hypothetical protein